MSRVDDQRIHAGVYERLSTLISVGPRADGCGYAQPAFFVLSRIGVLARFFDVFDGNKPFELVIFINKREFFNPVFVQNSARFRQCRTHRRRDQIVFRHDVADGLIVVLFKYQVSIGEDADQAACFISDGNAGYAIMLH